MDRAFGGSGRSFPAGDGPAQGLTVPDGSVGTTYMVSGGAGALTTDVFGFTCKDAACTYCTGINLNCPKEVFDNDKKATVAYDGRHNFALFTVSGGQMTMEAWATDSGNSGGDERIDAFQMYAADFDGSICKGGDAGPLDAGPPGTDAGHADAGPGDDAGAPDAGAWTDGGADAGPDHSGPAGNDAGPSPADSGTGEMDAGVPAAGVDSGATEASLATEEAGCGCGSAHGGALLALLSLAGLRRRR